MLKYAFNLLDGGFGIILPEIEDKCHWQPEEIRGKPSEFWRRKLEGERCLYHKINHILYVKVFSLWNKYAWEREMFLHKVCC